jgi:carboxyl-terminal processing protease
MFKISKMKSLKYIIPGFLLILLSFTFDNSNNEKNKLILELMNQSLSNYHYKRLTFDNDFSEKAYHIYIQKLDYNKRFFIQSDINQFAAYKYKIDESVLSGDLSFYELTNTVYRERLNEVNKYIEAALKSPFNFNDNETLETDAEKMLFAKDKKELKDYWRKLMKYSVMTKIASKLSIQEEAVIKNDTSIQVLSFEELEKKAREEVKKTYDDWFYRVNKIDDVDMISLYFNAITEVFDPHTNYFPAKDKENFDIHISGQLEGIGATLSQPNAYIKVERLVPGSPCWKQGELEVGDLILKVAQGSEEPVDVVDMRLDEAIKMIRGKKGTEVRLTVKKADGSIKIIPIIRDIVVIEETFAKSAVITDTLTDTGIGYLYLPQFYADFSDNNGRQCAKDVEAEILKLKKEKIDGLIFDLRDNGGGSLIDAIEIVGLFIDKGPVVQVRNRSDLPQIHNDFRAGALYEGNLVVMVNEFSASASEIAAAAIQDYNRGIIVGSKHTFGKGTVQRFLPFDEMVKQKKELKPLGDLKITIQKFYRINGGATQLKGVESDIVLPDAYSQLDMGEKDMDYPMEWDEIPRADYNEYSPRYDEAFIKLLSEKRIAADTSFQIINDYAAYLKESDKESIVSLNLNTYREEEKQKGKAAKRFRNADNRMSYLKFALNESDALTYVNDSIKMADSKQWLKELKKDIYLEEVFKIAKDMK